MAENGKFLPFISGSVAELSPSERRVANYVLETPQMVMRMNLAILARDAAVSEPTVIRFCRAVGCEGFSDFKIRLAQSLAVGAPYVHREVRADDSLEDLASKIFLSSIQTLADLRDRFDTAALERATIALAKARRIDCYGVGLASVAAIDAHQKLMRLGVPSFVYADVHVQTMSAATLQPNDVAIAFSYTGQIRDIVRTAQVAKEQGAFVIAVTRSDTELARICSMNLAVDTAEDTFVYAPMTTRLAHLAVIDVLATSVALRRGPDVVELFRKIKDTTTDQWIV